MIVPPSPCRGAAALRARLRGRSAHRGATLDARPRSRRPGRERRAERGARELLRSVVGEEAFAMYEQLGFIARRRRATAATAT